MDDSKKYYVCPRFYKWGTGTPKNYTVQSEIDYKSGSENVERWLNDKGDMDEDGSFDLNMCEIGWMHQECWRVSII